MSMRRTPSAVALAMTLLAAACEHPASPGGPPAEPPQLPELSRKDEDGGIDGEFARVQHQVPGFGGYYFDANGDLVVLLTDVAQEPAARALLAGVAADRPLGRGPARAAEVRVRRAEFDFATLRGWHQRMTSVLGLEGVDFLDTDEVANRVTVGVTSEAAAARVRDEAERAGVPPGALRVERMAVGGGPIATMRDLVRPVQGGVDIKKLDGYTCTLGFNVWYSNYQLGIPVGTRAFLTASHCTEKTWMNDGVRFSQGGRRIGHEIVDPPLFDAATTTRCPVGRRCRWSDAAVVQYDDSVAWNLGSIARPLWSASGWSTYYTLDIDPSSPYRITSQAYPTVGSYLSKVGRTTGETWGKVKRTCYDQRWDDNDLPDNPIILCQTAVVARAQTGDSGSPVFSNTSQGNVAIAGILWRRSLSPGDSVFVFSPVEQIRRDVVAFSPY